MEDIHTMSEIRGVLTVGIPHPGGENIPGPSVREKCGVAGLNTTSPTSRRLYVALRAIQHRGQESAGIATHSKKIYIHRGMGLVTKVFDKVAIDSLKGTIGIGHVRYSTVGTSNIDNAQPLTIHTLKYDIAIAHNGELVNVKELRKHLEEKGCGFHSESDSEIILRLITYNITKSGNIRDGLAKSMRIMRGSYSLVIMVNNKLFAMRDPWGVKPLAMGKLDDGYGVASESVVFDALGGEFLRDVKPGEIVEITPNGIENVYQAKQRRAHCIFEYVYFARPESIIEGRTVYEVRRNIGRILAKESPVDADIIVPVPDSGRAHALGYSEGSGIPFTEGLMKNRYDERTFIIPHQDDRIQEIKLKLNPVKSVIQGKRIVLVDDSIVRGNTMRKIMDLMWNAGAKEIHVRIGCPPITAPCYLGIDMKYRDQFIATGKSVDDIAKSLGATSLAYISVEGLVRAISIPKRHLCLGCLVGEYPIKIDGEKYKYQRGKNKKKSA